MVKLWLVPNRVAPRDPYPPVLLGFLYPFAAWPGAHALATGARARGHRNDGSFSRTRDPYWDALFAEAPARGCKKWSIFTRTSAEPLTESSW